MLTSCGRYRRTRLNEYEHLSGFRACFIALQNAEMVKQINSPQQAQGELVTTRRQVTAEIEHLRQENSATVHLTHLQSCSSFGLINQLRFTDILHLFCLVQLEAHRAEIERLKNELQTERAEKSQVHNALQSKEKVPGFYNSIAYIYIIYTYNILEY